MQALSIGHTIQPMRYCLKLAPRVEVRAGAGGKHKEIERQSTLRRFDASQIKIDISDFGTQQMAPPTLCGQLKWVQQARRPHTTADHVRQKR